MKGTLIVIDGLDGSGKNTQAKRLKETLEQEGKRVRLVSFPDYESPACAPVELYLNGAFGSDPDAVNYHYLTALSACDILFDDSMEALKELSKDYRIYFVTNGNAMVQRGRFGRSPVMEYIDDYFISGEIGYEKPDTRYFDAVFAGIPDFDREKTLLAGDSPTSDLTGAIRAGLDSCYVNRRGKTLPMQITPTYEVPDLASLVQLLRKEVEA